MTLDAFAFIHTGEENLIFVRRHYGTHHSDVYMQDFDWEKWVSEADPCAHSDEYSFDAEGKVWHYATGWDGMCKKSESVGTVYALVCNKDGYIETGEDNFAENIERYAFTI